MQGIENSELVYAPARETAPRRTVALEKPQLLDNATSNYRKQPSGPNLVTPAALRSSRGRWVLTEVTLPWSSRGEKQSTPDPVLQRGPPDLVVISHWEGVCEEHLWLCSEHPLSILI